MQTLNPPREAVYCGKMLDKYTLATRLGSGAHGLVIKALNRNTGDAVAIKRVQSEDKFLGLWGSIIREVSLLQDMEHENVVRLLEVLEGENSMYLVFEYMNCTLRKFMSHWPSTAMGPKVIKYFLLQILRGVAFCHSQKIIHRDLKPENLLLDIHNHMVKLADFGLSRAVDPPLKRYTKQVGTRHYIAPEMLFGIGKYSAPLDIWAVGCIFGEMVRRRPMFDGSGVIDQMYKIFRVMGTPNEENWPGVTLLFPSITVVYQWSPKDLSKKVPGLEPEGVDLLSRLLCLDPSRRITARDALKHTYFRDAYFRDI